MKAIKFNKSKNESNYRHSNQNINKMRILFVKIKYHNFNLHKLKFNLYYEINKSAIKRLRVHFYWEIFLSNIIKVLNN